MKRQKIQIIHDILKVIQANGGKSPPTKILYKANLSHGMMGEYIDELEEKNLVTQEEKGRSRIISLTDEGYAFLQKYDQVKSFMNSFGLS